VAEDLCWIFSTPNLTPFRSAESRDRCGSFEGLMQAAIGCTMLSARETPTQHAMDCRAWRKRRPLRHTLACQLPTFGRGGRRLRALVPARSCSRCYGLFRGAVRRRACLARIVAELELFLAVLVLAQARWLAWRRAMSLRYLQRAATQGTPRRAGG
jgi:hypothetical protein